MIKDDETLNVTKLFKVNEASIYLGVSESFIYKIIKSKKLIAVKIGVIYLITRTHLEEYRKMEDTKNL